MSNWKIDDSAPTSPDYSDPDGLEKWWAEVAPTVPLADPSAIQFRLRQGPGETPEGSLLSEQEVFARPCPVPEVPGVYAWFFDEIPGRINTDNCLKWGNATLLYVGISPRHPAKSGIPNRPERNLKARIQYHYRGSTSGSTLRTSLGCLLSSDLGIDLDAGLSFGEGEADLDRWMAAHARVTWYATDVPWLIEEELIASLDLPLNLAQNQRNPFHAQLSKIRKAQKTAALLRPRRLRRSGRRTVRDVSHTSPRLANLGIGARPVPTRGFYVSHRANERNWPNSVWGDDDIRWLAKNVPNDTVQELLDLTAAEPGRRVSFSEVATGAGKDHDTARSEMRAFTALIRRELGRGNRPVITERDRSGQNHYTMAPNIAAMWKARRHRPR